MRNFVKGGQRKPETITSGPRLRRQGENCHQCVYQSNPPPPVRSSHQPFPLPSYRGSATEFCMPGAWPATIADPIYSTRDKDVPSPVLTNNLKLFTMSLRSWKISKVLNCHLTSSGHTIKNYADVPCEDSMCIVYLHCIPYPDRVRA